MVNPWWNRLRFRLALWNAFAVALTALAVLFGLRQGVQYAILHEVDEILKEDIREIELALAEVPQGEFAVVVDELERKAKGHRHHGWFAQLFLPGGRRLWFSENAPAATTLAASTTPDLPQTIGNHRVVYTTVPVGVHQVAAVRVGTTMEFLRSDMARIDRMVLLTTLAAIVASPLIGYLMASRAAATIGEIIQTAARLRPHHLQERLPQRGSGDELDQLAQTVNSLLDRIALHLAENRDYLANAAHELRTPLAAIRSSVEVALGATRTAPEYEELLLQIIDQGRSLEIVVNQLMLISESEQERLKHEPEPVALHEIIKTSINMFRGVAESRQLHLKSHIEDGVIVPGRRHLLCQLVNNLVDNAIKYTTSGGQVLVVLSRDMDQQMAVISVTDNGVGIATDDIPRVFTRFFRADRSRTRIPESTGSGLGLSICESVVQAHQGTIACTSELDRGTSFTVSLPLVGRPA